MGDSFAIEPAEMQRLVETLGAIGEQPGGGIIRHVYDPAWVAARQQLLDDSLLIAFGESRAARQAETSFEERCGHGAAVRRRVRVDRLQVHGLPERARLDVLRLQREPDRLAIRARRLRVDLDARQPAVAPPV